ncbi:hypothetical protein BDV95DRAFT_583909 [Massariosphaeria phaeospora]|uniref:Pentatricopeptide repeat protein n=1 Tax=Massariosphaeria phaeospora TaxID=100035 RepID=A0A7C8I007_9PLEO|nr:hypothetical protein BDV95DRAFT_583909 [Massariosphaeria phaeospora]
MLQTGKHVSRIMQTLWSRATRNPGTCRCISSVSSPATIARRAGVVRHHGPRACATSSSTLRPAAMFIAGLTTGRRCHDKRKEQWDAAVAILGEELHRPPSQGTQSQPEDLFDDESLSHPSPLAPENFFIESADWDSILRAVGMELVEGDVFQERQSKIQQDYVSEDLWDLIQIDSRFPGVQALTWPANTGRDLVPHHLPPQSLWSPDHMRWTALRKRQTRKKLAIQELAIGRLIHSLLQCARVSRLPPDFSVSISPELRRLASLGQYEINIFRREIAHVIEKLQDLPSDNPSSDNLNGVRASFEGIAVPQYFQDSDGDFYQISRQMNTAIKHIFSGTANEMKDEQYWQSGQGALAVVKLCHNLLVSSAAPDVQTFNILISGFKRWRRADMVREVIKEFYVCKIRPNEITCVAILDHYIQNNLPSEFSRFVAKMRGMDNALMLARPDININQAGGDRLVRVAKDKVYQKIHPTPLVYNTIMLGVLRFAGFERALEIYYEMKEDGWGLDALALTHFLVDCVHRIDWNGGLFVWQEINTIKRKAKFSHMMKAYAQMLSLCSVAGKTVAFNQILNEVARRGLDRKAIIESAMQTTRMVQKKNDDIGPAWTADNVLIATEYMEDATPRRQKDDPFEESFPSYPDSTVKPRASVASTSSDPETAWSSWVAHELGEDVPDEPESDNKLENAAVLPNSTRPPTS